MLPVCLVLPSMLGVSNTTHFYVRFTAGFRISYEDGIAFDGGAGEGAGRTLSHLYCFPLQTQQRGSANNVKYFWNLGFGQNQPVTIPFGSFRTLRAFAGAVLPSEASTGHTTPGGSSTKSRCSPTWSWFSFCRARIGEIRCPAATQFLCFAQPLPELHRAHRQFGQFSRPLSGWKILTKSPQD